MTNQNKYTILYGRLSQEDEQKGDSNSIVNQRHILEKYKTQSFSMTMDFPAPISTAQRGMR